MQSLQNVMGIVTSLGAWRIMVGHIGIWWGQWMKARVFVEVVGCIVVDGVGKMTLDVVEMIFWLVWGFGDLKGTFTFQCGSGWYVCGGLWGRVYQAGGLWNWILRLGIVFVWNWVVGRDELLVERSSNVLSQGWNEWPTVLGEFVWETWQGSSSIYWIKNSGANKGICCFQIQGRWIWRYWCSSFGFIEEISSVSWTCIYLEKSKTIRGTQC